MRVREVGRVRIDVHRALRWLALAACAYFALHGVHAGLRAEGSDFTIFYRAGEAVLAGRDPTTVERFLYLPAFAVALAPLALLSYALALVLWQLASLAALVWISARAAGWCAGVEARPWLAWLPLFACLRLIDSNLANGQANLLVLGLVVCALDAWLGERPVRAGLWLALATVMKLLPGALLLVFLVRRSARAVGATLAGLLAGILLPALALGWHTNLAGLERWWRSQPLPYLEGGRALLAERDYVPGQSLTAAAYRLLTATPATSRGAAGPSAELVDLEPATVAWIVRGVGLAALALLGASLIVSRRRAAPHARLREAALAMCFALLLAPLVHKAHMVWLLVPCTLLCVGAPPGLGPRARGLRLFLLGLAFASIGLTPPFLLGRALATWLLAHDVVSFGLVCVTGALLLDVWNAREPARPG